VVTREDALLALLGELRSRNYRFTCVTPATHQRVIARRLQREPNLRDIFGWNRPFGPDQLAPEILVVLEQADCVEQAGGQLRSRVRVASLDDHLFLHSSYPTDSAEAVFFGPDTYRFVSFIRAHSHDLRSAGQIVDMGAGSGAGGIVAASLAPSARMELIDINPAAAELAGVNVTFAGVAAEVALSDTVPAGCDVVIANPPYMIDLDHRAYRDGGSIFGGEVALRWVTQALEALAPDGTMLLYTGAAIIDGRSPLCDRLHSLSGQGKADIRIEEIDPDVFGEELDSPVYRDVERIAALGIRISKTS